MSVQSWIEATAEQRAELRGLAGSSEREEADRARAILLSLEGWTSERIAAAFCAQPDSVRHWRWIFGREGVAGLRARSDPGRCGRICARPGCSIPMCRCELEEASDGQNRTVRVGCSAALALGSPPT